VVCGGSLPGLSSNTTGSNCIYMWQITTDLKTGVMVAVLVAVLEVLYLGSAQIPQTLIELYMTDHNGPGDGCDGGNAGGSLPGLGSNTTGSH
jgi:hypothetical protein